MTAFGATTVFAGMGVMTLLARVVDTDPTAVAVGSLAGLALGVGFALMIVERFREERARGTEPHPSGMAAARTVATGGRAVLWGGTAFAMCLILAVLISPTVILQSLGIGVLLCVLLSTGAAAVVMPAVLVILGHRLEAGSFPAPRPVAAAWARLVAGGSWVTRHPAPLAGLGVAALLALAVPALGLNTGPAGREPAAQVRAGAQGLRGRQRHDGRRLGDAVQHRRRLQGPAHHERLAAALGRPLPDPDRARPAGGIGRRAGRAGDRDQGPQEAPQEPE